jgi:cytochrome c
MKLLRLIRYFFILMLSWTMLSCGPTKRPESRLLVFSKTAGFRHASIAAGQEALFQLGKENGFAVDTTENSALFTEENLANYSAVVFLNTTQDVLDAYQQNAFERYIQAGGGFVGIHAATDTEYNWPWYNRLVGAYFSGHPSNPNVRTGTMQLVNHDHGSMTHLKGKETWERTDEFYNFKSLYHGDSLKDGIIPLINLDETSYEGGTNGDFHPMSWYHEFDGGRAWYTNFGHTDETFSEPDFLKHLLGGIQYAIGENLQPQLSNVRSPEIPTADRFVVTVLDQNLNEPEELQIMSDNRVIFIQRRGQLLIHDAKKKETKQIAQLNVYSEKEDGLVGMALDPNFDQNHWIYLYYAPPTEKPKFQLSRFQMIGDSLDMSSEIEMLEVIVQRQECCHTGGSIQFGSDGLLHLSTGDDTNPFETAYAPINELPGRGPWDAQKSSANPNDLRGKVLRIKPTPDGGYEIPEGNLFPKDGSEGRPEIYVMGCRNPYRISVDQKNGYVYWGDVGPDARVDSSRGPKGHDEVNQARKPGFFGWPLFVGDNKPYREVDFSGQQSGEFFDAIQPVNNSPNNTGKQQLPPAQKAFIWYPYDESKEFPIVGQGGRNAMAGPVYYQDLFPNAPNRFPKYYDGKLFIYDFMRDWVLLVTMNEAGDLQQMEHFLPDLKLSSPMDMEFGPDGAMYILEYGTRWFARNEDARLIRIDYAEGNRAPIPQISSNLSVGAAPLTVEFQSSGTIDYDADDQLTYRWDFGNGEKAEGETVSYTYPEAGIYQPTLTVSDKAGKSGQTSMQIRVGNQPPEIQLTTAANRSFFWKDAPISYEIEVMDKEDGSLSAANISAEAVSISFDYLEGYDPTLGEQGHAAMAEASLVAAGEKLITESGCIACHGFEKAIVGPGYQDVAKKYEKQSNAVEYLTGKILNGGSGIWGGAAMPAQAQLSRDQANKMATYILTLAQKKVAPPQLPATGVLRTDQHNGLGEGSTYTLRVSYTDQGGEEIGPLNAFYSMTLRSAKLEAETKSNRLSSTGTQRIRDLDGGTEIIDLQTSGYVGYENLDLTGLDRITLSYATGEKNVILEVHAGSPDGPLMSSTKLPSTGNNRTYRAMEIPLKSETGFQNLYLVAKNSAETEASGWRVRIDWLFFHAPPKSL